MTEHKPLTAELPKPILHVKWVSDKKAEWWKVAGNPVSFAGNPPREAVPYQSKFISMMYTDDVRSAVEGLRSGKISFWTTHQDATFQSCDECGRYVGKGPWIWFNKGVETEYEYQMCPECWVDYWFAVFKENGGGQ